MFARTIPTYSIPESTCPHQQVFTCASGATQNAGIPANIHCRNMHAPGFYKQSTLSTGLSTRESLDHGQTPHLSTALANVYVLTADLSTDFGAGIPFFCKLRSDPTRISGQFPEIRGPSFTCVTVLCSFWVAFSNLCQICAGFVLELECIIDAFFRVFASQTSVCLWT